MAAMAKLEKLEMHRDQINARILAEKQRLREVEKQRQTDAQTMLSLANCEDVAELFGCGKSKALLLMKQIGIVRIGKTPFVRTEDMEAFVRDNNAVKLNWPKKRRH